MPYFISDSLGSVFPVAAPQRVSRWLWLLPLAVALLFAVLAVTWLRTIEQAEREDAYQTLISDALWLQQTLRFQMDTDIDRLGDLADGLAAGRITATTLFKHPDVVRGLRRNWLSLELLDSKNRILEQIYAAPRQSGSDLLRNAASVGISTHFVAPVVRADGVEQGRLILRYSLATLLQQEVPWWLAQKYHVRLIDSDGQVIASKSSAEPRADASSYRISFDPLTRGTYLELLASRDATPWYTQLPSYLSAGFLLLLAWATWLLRRHVHKIVAAEAALRSEAAWRRAMEDSLTVGLRARDLSGRMLYVNRALADMLGWRPEELVGLTSPMPYWEPNTIEENMVEHQRTLEGKAPHSGFEASWRHRDGTHLDVMIFEAPLIDHAGTHVGWMGSVLDITERKRGEERERQQRERMAHHARLTTLGELASSLAHELNQPLLAISSYNAGALNMLNSSGKSDPRLIDALEKLGVQAQHAGRIVGRIREFLSKRAPQCEPLELGTRLREAADFLRPDFARNGVDLRFELAAELPLVNADPVLIEQVVLNLLRNAAEALLEQPEPRSIRVVTSHAGERFARIDVIDNGPGLGGRTVETLCAPFHSTKTDGMGMGLAICRSILEFHYGALEAGEAPGGGARFSFTLPFAQEFVDA